MIQHGNIMHWPPWAERLTRWNHVMLVANSSFNIVIYVFQVLIKIKHAIISFSWSIMSPSSTSSRDVWNFPLTKFWIAQDFKFRRALWEHIMCLASQVREEGRRARKVFSSISNFYCFTKKCPNWSKLFCYLRRSNNSIALVTIGTTAGQKEISLVETSD